MSRYQQMFERLKRADEGAFIPFVVLMDPDRDLSLKIMSSLVEAGADALELGIAFSDPLADGPTIQKAGLRALRNGSRVNSALELVQELRNKYPKLPIGILTYANLVFKQSLQGFYKRCYEHGVDSVLVADVPLLEVEPFSDAAISNGIEPVLLAPINLPLERCADIARLGRAYTYVVTRTGVTGAKDEVAFRHRSLIKALHESGAPPAIFGFGISTPAHVSNALLEGALGAISGSKVVSIIEDNLNDPMRMQTELKAFVGAMKQATKKS